MKHFLLSLIMLCFGMTATAQNILDDIRRDVPGQGKVTITQSPEIEALVRESAVEETTTTTTKTPAASKTESHSEGVKHNSASASASSATSTDAEANNSKKIMRRSYKATGYRIQVYSGGNKRTDKDKCEQIAARLKASFPNMPIYVHFYSPSWKCRAGNFKSHEEASRVLKQVRNMGYTQACLVKGTISVAY